MKHFKCHIPAWHLLTEAKATDMVHQTWPCSRERLSLRMWYSHPVSPLLLPCVVLTEDRHWGCSDTDAERALLNSPKNFPAPYPYPHTLGYLPGLSFPRSPVHHFHSVLWCELHLAGVIISCLSVFFDSVPHQQLFPAKGWYLQIVFPSACWKGCYPCGRH